MPWLYLAAWAVGTLVQAVSEAARARQEGSGDAAKYVNLQSGQEFLLTRNGKPFHCKIRRPDADRPENGAVDAASLVASKREAGGVASGLVSPLELRVSGLSRPLVLGLLADGAKFAGHADAVSFKSKADEAQRLVAFARKCVRVPRAASSAPDAAGPGTLLAALLICLAHRDACARVAFIIRPDADLRGCRCWDLAVGVERARQGILGASAGCGAQEGAVTHAAHS